MSSSSATTVSRVLNHSKLLTTFVEVAWKSRGKLEMGRGRESETRQVRGIEGWLVDLGAQCGNVWAHASIARVEKVPARSFLPLLLLLLSFSLS